MDNRRNRLSVYRARKLVNVHFNVRLLKKVRAVDYNSEYCAWEVEEVEAVSAVEEVEVEEVEAVSAVEEDLVVVQDEKEDSLRLRLITNGLSKQRQV